MPAHQRRHHTPSLRRGAIICDVDGTLARRHQPMGSRVATALADAAAGGWKIFILSGQPFSNIGPRVVPKLRLSFRSVPGALDGLRILTCEGASEWRVNGHRYFKLPTSDGAPGRITTKVQRRVARLLNGKLRRLFPRGVRLLQPPLWLEGAMCVLKVDARPAQRRLLANHLTALFKQHGLASLRVGLGGTFSIVITHHSTHKGSALKRIVESLSPRERAIYLADEFMETGNDVEALRVNNLVLVDFSELQPMRPNQVYTGYGIGPRAVASWLRCLGHFSFDQELDVDKVIRLTLDAGNL